MNEYDKEFEKAGLINLQQLDSSIIADLKYATTDNFVGKKLYPQKFGIYLEPTLAYAVANASRLLRQMLPHTRIVVFDAARPLSVQQKMFEIVKGTEQEKYVANPYGSLHGGFHNYGMAVDMSIEREDGNLLDMGTGFDYFAQEAHAGNEQSMVRNGVISMEAYRNRMLLYYVTSCNGMLPYEYEWWHFQIEQNEEDKLKHRLLEF